jgi:hypothetical protein
MTDLAVKRYPGVPRDVAFSKLFSERTEEALTLRKAWAIIKDMPRMTIMPVQVGNGAAVAVDNPVDALGQLQRLAEATARFCNGVHLLGHAGYTATSAQVLRLQNNSALRPAASPSVVGASGNLFR